MKVGARNQLKGKVTDIKRGDVMAQIKLAIPAASVMGSVITVDSLDELDLKVGDEVLLFVKAVHVLPIKAA
jgi:molybdate transport system regulatory protein